MPANGSNPSKAIPKKERKKEGDEAAPAALLKQKQHQQQKLQRKKLNSWIHVASSDIHTLS